MMRLITAFAVVGGMLTVLPSAMSSAASNSATTLFPLDGPNQLETHISVDCFKTGGFCNFTAGADTRTPDGVTGFPPGLWARQTTEIRDSETEFSPPSPGTELQSAFSRLVAELEERLPRDCRRTAIVPLGPG